MWSRVSIRKYKNITMLVSAAIFMINPSLAIAGGIALGGTRIIYPQTADQVSIAVSNTDAQREFLVQSWVSDINGKKSADFIVTPPLFVIQPNKENTLRIMYASENKLPTDRESVYYFNSKAIPSSSTSNDGQNTLQIASQSIIKLFVRPPNLLTKSSDAVNTLRCQLSGQNLTFVNPSPYYVTVMNVNLGGEHVPNTMVPPKESKTVKIQVPTQHAIELQTINDFGSPTPKITCLPQ